MLTLRFGLFSQKEEFDIVPVLSLLTLASANEINYRVVMKQVGFHLATRIVS